MPQVNATFIEKLKAEFKHTRFSVNDFIFNFPDGGKALVFIQFKYNKEYAFQITEEVEIETITEKSSFAIGLGSTSERKNKSIVNYVIYSPGEHKETDKIYVTDIGYGADHVGKWCKYIYSELTFKNLKSHSYDDLREQIESQFKDIENDHELFSDIELIKVNEKFDALLHEFENLKEEWNLTQAELNKVKEELEAIKASAKVMPKGIWAKMTNNKLVDILIDFSKSNEGRELFIAGIKKIMSVF